MTDYECLVSITVAYLKLRTHFQDEMRKHFRYCVYLSETQVVNFVNHYEANSHLMRAVYEAPRAAKWIESLSLLGRIPKNRRVGGRGMEHVALDCKSLIAHFDKEMDKVLSYLDEARRGTLTRQQTAYLRSIR